MDFKGIKDLHEKVKKEAQYHGLEITDDVLKDSLKKEQQLLNKGGELSKAKEFTLYIEMLNQKIDSFIVQFIPKDIERYKNYITGYAVNTNQSFYRNNVEKYVEKGLITLIKDKVINIYADCKNLSVKFDIVIEPESFTDYLDSVKDKLLALEKEDLIYRSSPKFDNLDRIVSTSHKKVYLTIKNPVIVKASPTKKEIEDMERKKQKVVKVSDVDLQMRVKTHERLSEMLKHFTVRDNKTLKKVKYVDNYGFAIKNLPILITYNGIIRTDHKIVSFKRLSTMNNTDYLKEIFSKNNYQLDKDDINFICNLMLRADNHKLKLFDFD